MAEIVNWYGVNKTLTTPKGEEKDRIADMPVFNNGRVSVSCWQLTREEMIEVINNNGRVYLAVMFGPSQPPVFVGSEETVRDLVVDYGKVWKKEIIK